MRNKSKEGHLPSHEVRILSSVKHPTWSNYKSYPTSPKFYNIWLSSSGDIDKRCLKPKIFILQKHSTPLKFSAWRVTNPTIGDYDWWRNYNRKSNLLSWRGCYVVPFPDLFLESLLDFWIKCTFILGVWGARLNMGEGEGGREGWALKG